MIAVPRFHAKFRAIATSVDDRDVVLIVALTAPKLFLNAE
jgi:hypothetical protein